MSGAQVDGLPLEIVMSLHEAHRTGSGAHDN